jgi:hypothetical protein
MKLGPYAVVTFISSERRSEHGPDDDAMATIGLRAITRRSDVRHSDMELTIFGKAAIEGFKDTYVTPFEGSNRPALLNLVVEPAPYEPSKKKPFSQDFDPLDPDNAKRFDWTGDEDFDRGWPTLRFRHFRRRLTHDERRLPESMKMDPSEISTKTHAEARLQQAYENQGGTITWWNVPVDRE